MNSDNVYIIILHWNNFRCTDFCLRSLEGITYKNIRVVIVDNHSTDGSTERLRELYPNYIYLTTEKNLGFARGSNVGMRYAYAEGADFVILLNNDVEVTPRFVDEMLKTQGGNSQIGLVTPKILYREDRKRIWHVGGHIETGRMRPVTRGYDEYDDGQYDEEVDTEWASGACCLISRKLIEEIGYLEEKYFFGQEEWDYSSTAIRNSFRIVYSPKAVVYHEIGQSATKNPALYGYQNVYNKFTYANKFSSTAYFYWWSFKYLVHVIINFPKKNLPHDKPDDFYLKKAKKAALWGIRDFFRGVYIDADRIKYINTALKKEYDAKYSDKL